MKQIEIFKTNNKEIQIAKGKINDWIQSEEIEVHSIEVVAGAEYKNQRMSSFDEKEFFIIVLYSKKQ